MAVKGCGFPDWIHPAINFITTSRRRQVVNGCMIVVFSDKD